MPNGYMNAGAEEQSPENKVSAGIDRAFQIYGANLGLFFDAVKADIKTGEHRLAVQMDLPLAKSK
jgi:hypothetical protein